MGCPRLFGLGLCAALLANPVSAQAMLDFSLEIDAPADADCTPARLLERAIEERVGHLVFLGHADSARRLHLVIAPDPAQRVWRAQIAMRDPQGELLGARELAAESARCVDLDEALIVVISTLIGVADQTPARPRAPLAAPLPKPPENHSVAPPPTAAAPTTITHQPPGQSDATGRDIELVATAGVRADLGLMPHLAFGPALGFEIDLGALSLALGAVFLPYATSELGGGARADFTSLVGDVGACLAAAQPLGATLAFCASAEAGVIAVSTSGLSAPANRSEALVRGLLGAKLRAPLAEHFGVLVELAAAFPVFTPRFYFIEDTGARVYYHSVKLGVSAQLGLFWVFSS
jgi:hypothetical protein